MLKIIFFISILFSCSSIGNEIKRTQRNLKREDDNKRLKKEEINREVESKKKEKNKKEKSLDIELLHKKEIDNLPKDVKQTEQKEETFLNDLEEIVSLEDLETFILNYSNTKFNVDKLEKYLKKHDLNHIYYSNKANINGKTLLMIAIELQNLETIKKLLKEENLYINQESIERKNALRYAIEKVFQGGSIDIVKELLKREDLFINYDLLKLDEVKEKRNLSQILEQAYEKKERISLDLYKLLEGNCNDYEIEELTKQGANLNYRYRYSNNAYMLRNFPKLAKEENKIKLIFKYGIGKDIFSYELAHILYSEKSSQFNINLDYLRFITEDLKINLAIKIKEENGNEGYRITTLIGEIYNKISQQKDPIIKKELLKYILTSSLIDLNKIDFSFVKSRETEIVPFIIRILEQQDLETVLTILKNTKISLEEIFNRYCSKEPHKVFNNILNKREDENQKLNILETLFSKNLNQNHLESEEQFLENVKNSNSPFIMKVKGLIKKYYSNIDIN